jgi:hypothetical protein
LQGPPKFTQIGIFSLKTNRLATLQTSRIFIRYRWMCWICSLAERKSKIFRKQKNAKQKNILSDKILTKWDEIPLSRKKVLEKSFKCW